MILEPIFNLSSSATRQTWCIFHGKDLQMTTRVQWLFCNDNQANCHIVFFGGSVLVCKHMGYIYTNLHGLFSWIFLKRWALSMDVTLGHIEVVLLCAKGSLVDLVANHRNDCCSFVPGVHMYNCNGVNGLLEGKLGMILGLIALVTSYRQWP